MSNYFKIFIAVFSAIVIANVFLSKLFSYWYQSDTELAIKQTEQKIAQYQKANAINIASMEKYQQKKYKLMVEKQAADIHWQQQESYENKLKYEAKRNKEAKDKKAYVTKREERKLKRERQREKERSQYKNKMADKEHIRNENKKTCRHWTEEYKRNPIAQNKSYRDTSCKRVYQ